MFRLHNIPLLTELGSICHLPAINILLLAELKPVDLISNPVLLPRRPKLYKNLPVVY